MLTIIGHKNIVSEKKEKRKTLVPLFYSLNKIYFQKKKYHLHGFIVKEQYIYAYCLNVFYESSF